MQAGVFKLLEDAGVQVRAAERTYRPSVSLAGFEAKILKPQNVIEMLAAGSRDIGFAGRDWVGELQVDVVELLDTMMDPVRLVAAAPAALLENGGLPKRRLLIASEYERITRGWIAERQIDADFVLSYGATEVFPPEDADCIVDNAATGETLRANSLVIIDELMCSSTRLYANPRALDDTVKREVISDLVLLLKSVLEAKERRMVELNVSSEALPAVLEIMPSMKQPTVSQLAGSAGFVVKAAVLRRELPALIPLIHARGGTDIIVFEPSQIVP